jgi:glycosyltransferase involved in cell wall biosynthesis
MKILIFSQHFHPENFRINEIAQSLVSKFSYELVVVTGKPNYPSGKIFPGYEKAGVEGNYSGFPVFRVPIWLRRSGRNLDLMLNYLSYIFSATVYSCFRLWKYSPDVVFCYATSPLLQAIPGIIYSKIFKKKFILNVQDLWPESLRATGRVNNKIVLKLVGWLISWIYRKSDLILIQSRDFSKKIRLFTCENKIEYWPNSVDNIFISPVTNEEVVSPLLCRKNIFTVMFAGNIGSAQSIKNIFNAACNLRGFAHIQLVILGDGSERQWLEDAICSEALTNIHLLGQFPMIKMPFLLRKADVLLATLADQDIFNLTIPNKIQAYMAVGKPILCAINGATANLIIDSASGVVVSADDAKALSDAILRMYEMPRRDLEIMGKNGHNYFRHHFSHDDLINQLDKYIKILVEEL